jgi:hypothetical protein
VYALLLCIHLHQIESHLPPVSTDRHAFQKRQVLQSPRSPQISLSDVSKVCLMTGGEIPSWLSLDKRVAPSKKSASISRSEIVFQPELCSRCHCLRLSASTTPDGPKSGSAGKLK